MSDNIKPYEPWIVAVRPGMDSVAQSAGDYLMSNSA